MPNSQAPPPWRSPAHLNPFAVLSDPLSQITDQVRLSSLFSSVLRVTPPFSRISSVDQGFNVLLMTQGKMYVEPIEGATFKRMLIEAGDVAVFPRGNSYRLLYPIDVPVEVESPLADVRDASRARPDETEFLGLICYLDRAHRNLMTDFLPQAIHLRKRTPGLTRWVQRTVDLFRAEHRSQLPGRSSILSRLAEIVCVQTLRIWIAQVPREHRGWFQGLKDEHIAAALQAIHKDPGREWTVASLAHRACLSRSLFAMRFKTVIGESPMEYVTRWRMHRALELLADRDTNLKSIVEASGYQSATAFRRTFKRQFGMLPSEYRRTVSLTSSVN